MLLLLIALVPIHLLFYGDQARAASLPQSCAEVKQANPYAGDGEYFLSVIGQPVQLYCAQMQSDPAEYITLAYTEEGDNYSHYAAGGGREGEDVVTRFAKVRFDPAAMEIIAGDLAFASSTGSLAGDNNGDIVSLPYGYAADCVGAPSPEGRGNVNLTGTPFAVADEAFAPDGFEPVGSADYSESRQVVELTGGGYCGAMEGGPEIRVELKGPTFDVFASQGQVVLDIQYPAASGERRFTINAGNEQQYNGAFLVTGDWTVTAYTYGAWRGAESRIEVGGEAADLEPSIELSDSFGRFAIAIDNVGNAPTDGSPVVVTAALPDGDTAELYGEGWYCDTETLQCSRSDVLERGERYPDIFVDVVVAEGMPAAIEVGASVAGGGEIGYRNNSAFAAVEVPGEEAGELVPEEMFVDSEGIQIVFNQPIQFQSIDGAKFEVIVAGQPAAAISAFYDESDESGRSVRLELDSFLAYGQAVFLAIGEGAVYSMSGGAVAHRPMEAVENLIEYEETSVVFALTAELERLDEQSEAPDGVQMRELVGWLKLNEGRDLTGDGRMDRDDVARLLRLLPPARIEFPLV